MSEEICYGFFPGGDPRRFTPDLECCTPEEVVRWKEDCDSWDSGDRVTVAVSGVVAPGIHVTRSAYGLGTYFIQMEDFDDESA